MTAEPAAAPAPPDAADGFAAEHAQHAADLALWRAVAARTGGPVLDLGCASGRVALPLAADGLEVWAVDADHRMLAALAQRAAGRGAEVAVRIRTVAADMRHLDLGRRFPLAIAAMNTLQVLLEPADQLACLRALAAHLDDTGELWFDVTMPEPGEIAGALGLVRAGGEHRDADTGELLVHTTWYEGWDPVTGTADYTRRIDRVAPGGAVRTVLRRHSVHLFSPPELAHLLARAGLEVVQCWGGFAGEPLDASSLHQVYRCRRGAP